MSVLPVTLANVKLLLGVSDTSQDTAITALMSLEQPALEYALDPAVLTYAMSGSGTDSAGLQAVLVMGAAEVLAGSYMATAGRNPEYVSSNVPTQLTFKVATTEVMQKPLLLPPVMCSLGAQLTAVGLARLKPFSRSARSLARAAAGGDVNLDMQVDAPLVLGSGMGSAGVQPWTGGAVGPPPDSVFDRALGRDGRTEPPGSDDFSPGVFGWFGPGGEP